MTTTEPLPSTPDVAEFLSEERFRIYDILLAVTLTLCTLVGLPGNIVSLLYFYSAKQRNFSNLIYMFVCCIDIGTSIVPIPVMIALYNARRPGIFGEAIFCVGWSVFFYYLQRMSMFLVMLMSVSRSIKLIFLLHKIERRFLILSFLLYTGFIIIHNILAEIFGGENNYGYSSSDVYCYYELEEKPFSYIDLLVANMSIGIPPIITTISFTVFFFMLMKKRKTSKTNKKTRQAAVTMALFTFLFLACNLPCFLNNILWFMSELSYESEYPEPFYAKKFMFFYSWVISDIFCTALNAALNPVLYFCRIKNLRDWVKSRIQGTTLEHSSTVRSTDNAT